MVEVAPLVGSVQVLRKSMRLTSAERLRPSSRASAAGSAYDAAASSCAACADPAIAMSRALMLGTTYPPAEAATGTRRAAMATKSLRMVVPL